MNRRDLPFWFGMGVAVLAVAGGLWLLLAYRREVPATITHTRWKRAIDIEAWTTLDESDWWIPSGGRKVREYAAIHHWETYQSGSTTECKYKGNGNNRRYLCETEPTYSSRPVWATRYDYQIERWRVVRTPEREGVDTPPVWPDVSDLRASPALAVGDERPGRRSARYTVDLSTADTTYSLDVDEGQWATLHPGQRCQLALNVFGWPIALSS